MKDRNWLWNTESDNEIQLPPTLSRIFLVYSCSWPRTSPYSLAPAVRLNWPHAPCSLSHTDTETSCVKAGRTSWSVCCSCTEPNSSPTSSSTWRTSLTPADGYRSSKRRRLWQGNGQKYLCISQSHAKLYVDLALHYINLYGALNHIVVYSFLFLNPFTAIVNFIRGEFQTFDAERVNIINHLPLFDKYNHPPLLCLFLKDWLWCPEQLLLLLHFLRAEPAAESPVGRGAESHEESPAVHRGVSHRADHTGHEIPQTRLPAGTHQGLYVAEGGRKFYCIWPSPIHFFWIKYV